MSFMSAKVQQAQPPPDPGGTVEELAESMQPFAGASAMGARSICILHPESQLDGGRFSFDDFQVQFAQPSGETSTYGFDRVLPSKTPQEKVFQEVAREPVVQAVEHFVSAAFIAFGCSGSGKTFTVTGGAKRFADRGLIPRSISALFEVLGARPDRDDFEVAVSFYEIYKDAVVDLLSERRRRVTMQKGAHGPVLLGLLRQTAQSESDAYHLLFQGDSNRHFERLPLNAETSRGHVFYVLHVTHLPSGRETNLSFIDLAAVVSSRNHATSSVERSLEAFTAVVAAMNANLDEPPFDVSILTQLLEPVLSPRLAARPHISIINPIRFMDGYQQDMQKYLDLGRELKEVLCSLQKAVESPPQGAGSPLFDSSVTLEPSATLQWEVEPMLDPMPMDGSQYPAFGANTDQQQVAMDGYVHTNVDNYDLQSTEANQSVTIELDPAMVLSMQQDTQPAANPAFSPQPMDGDDYGPNMMGAWASEPPLVSVPLTTSLPPTALPPTAAAETWAEPSMPPTALPPTAATAADTVTQPSWFMDAAASLPTTALPPAAFQEPVAPVSPAPKIVPPPGQEGMLPSWCTEPIPEEAVKLESTQSVDTLTATLPAATLTATLPAATLTATLPAAGITQAADDVSHPSWYADPAATLPTAADAVSNSSSAALTRSIPENGPVAASSRPPLGQSSIMGQLSATTAALTRAPPALRPSVINTLGSEMGSSSTYLKGHVSSFAADGGYVRNLTEMSSFERSSLPALPLEGLDSANNSVSGATVALSGGGSHTLPVAMSRPPTLTTTTGPSSTRSGPLMRTLPANSVAQTVQPLLGATLGAGLAQAQYASASEQRGRSPVVISSRSYANVMRLPSNELERVPSQTPTGRAVKAGPPRVMSRSVSPVGGPPRSPAPRSPSPAVARAWSPISFRSTSESPQRSARVVRHTTAGDSARTNVYAVSSLPQGAQPSGGAPGVTVQTIAASRGMAPQPQAASRVLSPQVGHHPSSRQASTTPTRRYTQPVTPSPVWAYDMPTVQTRPLSPQGGRGAESIASTAPPRSLSPDQRKLGASFTSLGSSFPALDATARKIEGPESGGGSAQVAVATNPIVAPSYRSSTSTPSGSMVLDDNRSSKTSYWQSSTPQNPTSTLPIRQESAAVSPRPIRQESAVSPMPIRQESAISPLPSRQEPGEVVQPLSPMRVTQESNTGIQFGSVPSSKGGGRGPRRAGTTPVVPWMWGGDTVSAI